METISVLHTGNIGDCWASLPAVKELHRRTGKKIIYYLVNGTKAFYYEGATHPTRHDTEGHPVMLNTRMIQMMIPFLKAQPFIEDAAVYTDEKIHLDLSQFREASVGMPNLSINRWYFYITPDLGCDLSKPWLTVPYAKTNFARNKILINRTERYTNSSINYSFLKEYQDECVFVGTMREWNNFCMEFDLEIEKVHVNDFLEFAQAIQQCRFYIGNQSQGYQLCQGQFHPSILEVCSWAPNVIPIGEKMYDFLFQLGLEYYFHKLNGSEEAYLERIKKDRSEREAALNR